MEQELNVSDESCATTVTDETTAIKNKLKQLVAKQVTNTCDLNILSISNDEFLFCLQDLDEDMQLFYDYEKETNVTVEDYAKMKFLQHPCPEGSLIKYRDQNMKKINGQIYKKVENRGFGPIMDLSTYKVVFEYSHFLENSTDPLDSSRFKRNLGTIHISKDLFTFAGIQDAVSTMKYKEQALFWISYELMYGTLGVKPRIPPKADFLVRIKIVKIFDNDLNELNLKISKFEETLETAGKNHALAKSYFNKEDYNAALAIFRKWINTLENTHLANEEQENEVKQHLIKMYLNLCLCYNKIKNPQRTCLAMRELEKLTSISNNVKALFAKGKAQMMLHNENEAEKCFLAALKIDPENPKILKTLNELKNVKFEKMDYSKQMEQLNLVCNEEEMELEAKRKHIDKFLNSLE